MLSLKERFVTDAEGRRIAVKLDLADYQRLLEALRLADILRAPTAATLSELERQTVLQDARQAVDEMRAEAEARDLGQLTDAEIQAEVKAARAARRLASS